MRLARVATVTLLASVLLGACAAPQATGLSREAGVTSMGVMVCVVNESAKPVRVHWWRTDTHDPETTLLKGQSSCGEGTAYYYIYDVGLRLEWRDGQSQSYYLGNSWIGYPQASIDPDLQTAASACGLDGIKGPNGVTLGFSFPCSDAFDVNEERFYPSGTKDSNGKRTQHLVSIKRVEDTAWKEFRIYVQW